MEIHVIATQEVEGGSVNQPEITPHRKFLTGKFWVGQPATESLPPTPRTVR